MNRRNVADNIAPVEVQTVQDWFVEGHCIDPITLEPQKLNEGESYG